MIGREQQLTVNSEQFWHAIRWFQKYPGSEMSGKYFDDLAVGLKIQHRVGRTVTEMDNVLFCSLTMNSQPLHLDEHFAAETEFGHRIVNGVFTMGLVVGLSVADLTEGTIVANLGYDKVQHPKPVFHGDTIYAESEILELRESQSKPDRGIVRVRQIGRNQRGEIVCELERSVMFRKRPAGDVSYG
jgi:acyl dehydratase